MGKKKKLTPEQELRKYRDDLMESYEWWGEIKLHGCNDPAWTDGQNLNLVRSHIIGDMHKIIEMCAVNGLPRPPEFYLAVPPEAPKGYMASLGQAERVKQLQAYGYILSTNW